MTKCFQHVQRISDYRLPKQILQEATTWKTIGDVNAEADCCAMAFYVVL